MERLFIYGTLQIEAVQQKLLGRTMPLAPAELEHYRRSTITLGEETYPMLVPDKYGAVDGWLMELTPDELKIIDDYETSAYRRVQETLRDGSTAWVYVKP